MGRFQIDGTEVRRDARVEERNVLLMDQVKEVLRFLIRDDELNLDCERSSEFEKSVLAKLVAPSKAGRRLEGGAAMNAMRGGLNEKPFPQELAVMAISLVNVESQE